MIARAVRRLTVELFILAMVAVGLAWSAPTALAGSGPSVGGSQPSLVVLIVVDQLRGDYFDAFRDYFAEGGFNRLIRDGAWFSNAHFTYGTTATGPGHATLATGAPPSIHGIVANDWVEFASESRSVYCCGDDSVRGVGLPEGRTAHGRSPRQLRVPTIGDAIKAATAGRGKVWGVSIKDRAAILTAGERADGAIWWDGGAGRFVTSSYYGSALPPWARAFNEERYADRYFHTTWDRLLPEALYGPRFLAVTGDRSVLKKHDGQFPKILGERSTSPDKAYYGDLLNSPFGNELVFEAARRLISAEQFGSDDAVDFLSVGLSSNDIVGHTYGPDSDAVMDCTLRTDRQLAEFLDWLDERIGREKYLLALSSDHGVGPMPEYAIGLGIASGRIDAGALAKYINRELAERFPAAGAGKLVHAINLPWVYLDEAAIGAAGLDQCGVARTIARLATNFTGIARALAVCDLPSGGGSRGDDLTNVVRNSAYPGRSGHVYLHWERYWYKGAQQAGHGAAYDYDQHVPIMLMGPGIRSGRYADRVDPSGMAATICAVLGIAPPSPQCSPALSQALSATVKFDGR